MPTNQLAPLVSTIWINLAGNSFQVIMEMEMEMEMVGLMMAAPPYFLIVKWMLVMVYICNYEVEVAPPTFFLDGDDRTATLSWDLLIMTCLRVFCKSQSLFRLQLQEVPSHALRSLQRLEQLDLSHLARLSQVQVGNTDDHDGIGDHIVGDGDCSD